MKLVKLSTCLLLWIFCLQQYCFLGTVRAEAEALEKDIPPGTERPAPKTNCSNDTCDCKQLNDITCLQQKKLQQDCNCTCECSAPNATCGICACISGFYQTSNLTECLPQKPLQENCTSESECLTSNANCSNGICDCKPGFYELNQTMCLSQKHLKENCSSGIECMNSNANCSNSICDCNPGFYQNGDECLQKRNLFESCNDGKECKGDKMDCIDGKCNCTKQYYIKNNECFLKKENGEECTSANECLHQHTVCTTKICKCDDDHYDAGRCVRKRNLFESCNDGKECKGDKMDCIDGKCNCTKQYYIKNNECFLRLGIDSHCQADRRMCEENSVCRNSKCVCNDDHYRSDTVCFMKNGYGVSCDEPDSCTTKNADCINNKCTCKEGYIYKVKICQETRSNAVIIAIIVVLIFLLIGLLIFILWKIKKQTSDVFKPPKKATQVELGITRSRPILMSKFPDAVDTMHQDSNKIYSEQFLDLARLNPLILTENSDLRSTVRKYLPCQEATKAGNTSKNRFLDILPFDHSRVKLQPVDEEPDTDYINANYISGYSREKEYIAAQGPLAITGSDFWRMVWQEKVSIVVMLTLCREKEMNKCDNYWPLEKGSKLDFDDITVETTNVTHYHSYDYRGMILKIEDTTRSLKHFHFLQWADFSANVPVEILINFVQNVRSNITSNAPIVVHCSAGVGRTGTFIAVDYMLQFVDANPLESNIDIFKFVSKMRANRVHMVQNEKQYILVHDCIKHAVKKKMGLENGEPDDADGANPYENPGFVTIDLAEKELDEKPTQDLGSVEMIIEENEEEDEENPYENEVQGVPNAEKDGLNDSDSDYDIPKTVTIALTVREEDEKPTQDLESVTIDLAEKELNEKPTEDLGSVTIDLAEKELDEKPTEDLGSVQMTIEGNGEQDEEENPYENEIQAELLNTNEEDKLLDDSDKPKSVTFGAEEAEDENPYENQEFDESDEKSKLTSL